MYIVLGDEGWFDVLLCEFWWCIEVLVVGEELELDEFKWFFVGMVVLEEVVLIVVVMVLVVEFMVLVEELGDKVLCIVFGFGLLYCFVDLLVDVVVVVVYECFDEM